AHILLWLEELWKCKMPSEIDDIISAKLPSPTDDPDGYKVVTDYMLHGPCGKDARYAACTNDVWHLFSIDIHYSYPTVMQLSFHLPNQNAITMRDSERLPALPQREGIDVTMFTDWFELNKRDPTKRTLTYVEIPKNYVWHEQTKLWKPRKQRKCIGRIVYSSPASGERYYLRMLLNVVRGVTGFEELMTVNKRIRATFKEAHFAYGLLNDDKEWTQAILEASLWALGPQLRDIFITLLLFCDVSKPLKLCKENWQTLSKDILHKKRKLSKSLADFKDLPQPNPSLLTNLDNRLIREALDFDIKKSKAEHRQFHSLLNPEQRLIYEDVVESVHNKKGNFYFVYGSGGTGKTFLYKTIISRLRSERMIVLAVASSVMLFA
ncbi:uncharacterized protein Tco_1436869, partial [Tanacetum coccineum]